LWVRNVIIVGALTAAGIGAFIWWEDRPLRAIEASLASKEYSEAASLANAYLKEFPGRSRAVELKARALAGIGHWEEAVRLFEASGAIGSESLHDWARALLKLQRWSEALPLLLQLHSLDPQDAETVHELAACYGQFGEYDSAVYFAGKLKDFPQHEAAGRLLLGTLENNRGNYRLALEAWRPIVDADSAAENLQVSRDELLLAFGRALLKEGRADEARTYLQRSLAIRNAAETSSYLGDACEQMGDLDRAVDYWKQAVAADSTLLRAREGLARASIEQRQPDQALKWLEPVAEEEDLPSSVAYLFQRSYTLVGDPDRAKQWEARVDRLRDQENRSQLIDDGVQRAPNSFWSRAVRAHRFASRGNSRQAAMLLDQLLEEAPDEPFIRKLAEYVQNRGPLPSLEMIPMKQF
jgi:tetratricopeptide (TPR) repeat protein